LLRYTRGTRRYLIARILLGGLTAGLVICQARVIAVVISHVAVGGAQPIHLGVLMAALLVVVCCRAATGWLGERTADRASSAAKSDLRSALVDRIGTLGPATIDRQRSGRLVVLATTGIDALDSYFARYVPQLVLAVIVPVTVIVVVASADWKSALILALTVPLIPYFMALIGTSVHKRMERQSLLLQRLSGHFLDVVAGLPTLKVFNRAKAQARAVRDITNRYRMATMATLRLAFLSSLSLELLATFSVAMVAVAVGLRLLGGHLNFETALFILILAPEAYAPLRTLGANYHSSAEGVAAATEVFELLDREAPVKPLGVDIPDVAVNELVIEGLEVRYAGRPEPGLRETTLIVRPGEILAIAGPSGCGKSTLISVLLGLTPASAGSIRIGTTDLDALDPVAWRSQIGWVPQRPHLFARSIADNIRLGRPDANDRQLRAAIASAGLDEVIARLPDGMNTMLGTDGSGVSAGERQRVALARAFLRDAPLLLLDEPTAHLDSQTETEVLDAVRRLMLGRTVIMVAHRPSLVALADRVVSLDPALVR
jgi:thiol reductant ABC exporter CydD subunit